MLRLTQERERRGWSRSELARRARIQAPALGQVELGKMAAWPGWRRRLSRVLKVPADELFKEVTSE